MSDDERPTSSGAAGEDAHAELKQKVAKSAKTADKKIKKLKEKYERRGIVYISRLPPHLVRFKLHSRMHAWSTFAPFTTHKPPFGNMQKPQKLRHMLEQHGSLGRIYLAPEGELEDGTSAAPFFYLFACSFKLAAFFLSQIH